MNNVTLVLGVIAVLDLVAIADVWTTRLTTVAKVLWTLIVVFLPVVGLATWALTRGSARQDVEEIYDDAASDLGTMNDQAG